VSIDTLPRREFDRRSPLVICDPYPTQSDSDAGDSTLVCSEGSNLAWRAVLSLTEGPVDRLYLRRPMCTTYPCTREQLDTAIVDTWWAGGSMSVALDSRLDHVTITTDDPSASWPSASSTERPPAKALIVADAPREIARREVLPSCGVDDIALAEHGDPDRCFLDAVLTGGRAEFLEFAYGTEGGRFQFLYRYDGDGAPQRYRTDDAGSWVQENGALILNPDCCRSSWSFEPWWGTDTRL